MKRNKLYRIGAVMIMIVLIVSLLAGCGGNTKDIKKAGEGMLNALKDGDLDKISEFVSEKALTEGDLSFVGDMKNFTSDMVATLGVTEDDLVSDAKKAIENLGDGILKEYVSDFEILDVQEEEAGGYVTCKVNYGYDPAALEKTDFKDQIQKMVDEYVKDHVNELTEIYTKEGAKALTVEVVNKVMPSICKIVSDGIVGTDPKEEVCLIKVEKVDDKWLVTEAKVAEEKKDSEGEGDSETESESEG